MVLASCTRLVSEHQPRSEEQVSSLLKFMGKHLAKDILESKSRTKGARDQNIVPGYDVQGIQGFRGADMVIEVTSSIPVHVSYS